MLNYTPCRARRLRLRYRIPLSELAQAAGVSIQLINKIELERELAQCGGLFQTVEGDDYGL